MIKETLLVSGDGLTRNGPKHSLTRHLTQGQPLSFTVVATSASPRAELTTTLMRRQHHPFVSVTVTQQPERSGGHRRTFTVTLTLVKDNRGVSMPLSGFLKLHWARLITTEVTYRLQHDRAPQAGGAHTGRIFFKLDLELQDGTHVMVPVREGEDARQVAARVAEEHKIPGVQVELGQRLAAFGTGLLRGAAGHHGGGRGGHAHGGGRGRAYQQRKK
jgi:hypothetical protein